MKTPEEKKEARQSSSRRWREAHPEYYRHYYETHSDEIKEKSRRHYADHRGESIERRRQYHEAHQEEEVEKDYRRNQKIKIEVLSHYSKGIYPKCAHCDEERLSCLSIDHIRGKGVKHRKDLNISGNRFYHWLKSQGYPKGYQVLCMNCQWVKRVESNECHRKVLSEIQTAIC